MNILFICFGGKVLIICRSYFWQIISTRQLHSLINVEKKLSLFSHSFSAPLMWAYFFGSWIYMAHQRYKEDLNGFAKISFDVLKRNWELVFWCFQGVLNTRSYPSWLTSLIYAKKFDFENPAIMECKQCKQTERFSVMAKGSDYFLS